MENHNRVFLGTEIKLNINIDSIQNNLTMDDYDFRIELYNQWHRNDLIIQKKDAIRIDEKNYIITVDTNILGTGELKCKVVASIPDDHFTDGYRTEVVSVDTGIYIVAT